MRSTRRFFSTSLLVIALCSILGGFFGSRVTSVSAAGSEEELNKSLKDFTRVLRAVEENYADKVTPDKAIYQGAIPGMLRTLDPHSSFYDPRLYAIQRENQRGQYFGVGMSVQPKGPYTKVVYAFSKSPALRAGLRPGDMIVAVNGKQTKGLTTNEVVDLLKGPRGTEVAITVEREAQPAPLTFRVVRDAIERRSVEEAFFVKPGIAYLAITEFNENTSREMEDNLRRLGEDNIKGLILDLRDNHGGLLTEGVAVTEHFLQRGQQIVSHKGRSSPERGYVARKVGRTDYPIVVVVDRDTASAAEIVSGALQDHDRAWIFGEQTFGKGLVQTVYNLPDQTGLALTTAHYYTPSGRLIQRDYSKSSFFDYYYSRRDNGKPNEGDVAKTDSGRTVYGGNGISPDEKWTAPKPTKLVLDMFRLSGPLDNLVSKFVRLYFSKNNPNLAMGTRPNELLMNDFREFIKKEGAVYSDADWAASEEWFKGRIRSEMHLAAFGFEASRRISVEDDPQIKAAVDSLPKAVALLEKAQKVAQNTRP